MSYLDKYLDKHYLLNKYEAKDMEEQYFIVDAPQPLPKSKASSGHGLRFLAWAKLCKNRQHHKWEKYKVRFLFNTDLSGGQRHRT